MNGDRSKLGNNYGSFLCHNIGVAFCLLVVVVCWIGVKLEDGNMVVVSLKKPLLMIQRNL